MLSIYASGKVKIFCLRPEQTKCRGAQKGSWVLMASTLLLSNDAILDNMVHIYSNNIHLNCQWVHMSNWSGCPDSVCVKSHMWIVIIVGLQKTGSDLDLNMASVWGLLCPGSWPWHCQWYQRTYCDLEAWWASITLSVRASIWQRCCMWHWCDIFAKVGPKQLCGLQQLFMGWKFQTKNCTLAESSSTLIRKGFGRKEG